MQDHIVASFAPNKVHTRNSEGAFIRLNDGSIYFAFSRFSGSDNDAAPSDIVAIRSCDEGETWSEPETVIPASVYGATNTMSVSLLRMNNGDIGLFHGVRAGTIGYHVLSLSSDEGKTFYRHITCSLKDRPGYYVMNNDRVERLSSGRIIMPMAFHRGGHSIDRTAYFDGRAFNVFLYSDDDGETWAEAPGAVYPNFTRSTTGLQEPGIIEKKNGVLWGYARTDMMYQYEYFSMDGGMHWTEAQPSRFTSPRSPMKIKRHPETGDLYAVWNPIPPYNGRPYDKAGWGRTPLVWAVSKDDGVTWSDYTVIEDKDDHGYCYPAMFFTNDGAMLCAYCAGGPEDGICLARLTMKKLYI